MAKKSSVQRSSSRAARTEPTEDVEPDDAPENVLEDEPESESEPRPPRGRTDRRSSIAMEGPSLRSTPIVEAPKHRSAKMPNAPMLDDGRTIRAAKSYAQYHDLSIKPKENFNDFYAEFSRLAEEANILMLYRKRDLYSKLPYLLQSYMIGSVNKETIDIEKSSYARAEPRSTALTKKEPTGSPPSFSAEKRSPLSIGKTYLTNAERLVLIKEGRCFHCREPGHITIECPKKKPALASVAATRAVTTGDLQGAKEAS
ncbi:hypothetical protein PENANT_c063G07826 [Penicillium antarcticum]|uniref:CCHC-type domain-containing protein n=1 Tax=Penicillium antarcticum TaxID=416450 RepID=A0A1V6PPU2_9EURO|nr:hypothetical protein PENANT_c063G07826 [Penicillium antarcticum]